MIVRVLVVDEQVGTRHQQDAKPYDDADDQKYIRHCQIVVVTVLPGEEVLVGVDSRSRMTDSLEAPGAIVRRKQHQPTRLLTGKTNNKSAVAVAITKHCTT